MHISKSEVICSAGLYTEITQTTSVLNPFKYIKKYFSFKSSHALTMMQQRYYGIICEQKTKKKRGEKKEDLIYMIIQNPQLT